MGNSPIMSASTSEVADAVREIGEAYWEYAAVIEENGVNGATILEYDDVNCLLDDLGITKRLHRMRLRSEVKRQPSSLAEVAKKLLPCMTVVAKGDRSNVEVAIGQSPDGKALRWGDRGWASSTEFEREFAVSGIVARAQTAWEADALVRALAALDTEAHYAPNVEPAHPDTVEVPQRTDFGWEAVRDPVLYGLDDDDEEDEQGDFEIVVEPPDVGDVDAYLAWQTRLLAAVRNVVADARTADEQSAWCALTALQGSAAVVARGLSEPAAARAVARLKLVLAKNALPCSPLIRVQQACDDTTSAFCATVKLFASLSGVVTVRRQAADEGSTSSSRQEVVVFEYGRITDRRFESRRARRLVAAHAALFFQAIPAAVLSTSAAARRLLRDRLPELDKCGWFLETVVRAMADGERSLDVLVGSLEDEEDDAVRCVVEQILSCVVDLETAGLVFNIGPHVRDYFERHERCLRAIAGAVRSGPEDDLWHQIDTRVLPEQERRGWQLTAAVRALREGARSIDRLTDECDPNSAVLVQALLNIVLDKTPLPPQRETRTLHAEHRAALDDSSDEESDDDQADDYYEYGRRSSMSPTMPVPDLAARHIQANQQLFSALLPAVIAANDARPKDWQLVEREVLPKLEDAGWCLTNAINDLRTKGLDTDVDRLTAFLDQNESAVVEHVLMTARQLRAADLHFNINKPTRRCLQRRRTMLARFVDAIKGRECDTVRFTADVERLERQGWQIKDAIDAMSNGTTDLFQLTATCDLNSAVVVEAIHRLLHDKPFVAAPPASDGAHPNEDGSDDAPPRTLTRTTSTSRLHGSDDSAAAAPATSPPQ